MSTIQTSSVFESLSKEAQTRAAVLQCFCDTWSDAHLRLPHLSRAEWRRLLHWLDVSGLALYFLDRIDELHMRPHLPAAVVARLEQNLRDNTDRTRAMIAESCAIQTEFQEASLSYAVLKGFSLWPCSVPRPELRSQLDLDFLIAENDAAAARRILEQRGYRLHAISGRSWEFKTTHPPGRSLADLYKALPFKSVELHLESSDSVHNSLLDRARERDFEGIVMPVLAPADLFLGQGVHLFKHICSEFSRAAHLLEFRRHVVARYDDRAFWQEVRRIAAGDRRTLLALGTVTLLITHVMGDFAPAALTCWTVDSLPDFVRLWVEFYGRRSIFDGLPGNKRYLLLQRELEGAGFSARRPLRRALLPLKLPPPLAIAPEGESLLARFRRYRAQLKFILFRLRFHTIEGFRFALESGRWQRELEQYRRQSHGHLHRSPSAQFGFASDSPGKTKE
jgi:hypothetical protein